MNSMIFCFFKATCFTLASSSALSGLCTRVDLTFFPTYEAAARLRGFSGGLVVIKKPSANAGDKRRGFDPWVRKIPRSREWQPTPAFLPGASPWIEEPGGLQSMGSQRARHDWSDWSCTHVRLRVYVPWIWWWHWPVSGSLQIGLEGCVSGIQSREPVRSISLWILNSRPWQVPHHGAEDLEPKGHPPHPRQPPSRCTAALYWTCSAEPRPTPGIRSSAK